MISKVLFKLLLLCHCVISFYYVAAQNRTHVDVLKNFSKSLQLKIYSDVLSKIELSDTLQLELAKLYSQRDSLLWDAFVINTDSAKFNHLADSLSYSIEILFKRKLNTEKKREYFLKVERSRVVNYPIIQDTIYMGLQMDSQFGLALALYEKMQLKQKQKDSLIFYAKLLKKKELFAVNFPDSGIFDKPAFESLHLSTILTELEYNGLLSIKNKLIAEANSRDAWFEMKRHNLVTNYGREDTLLQLKMFYLARSCFWDKYAHKPDLREMIIRNIKPPVILNKIWAIKRETAEKTIKYNW
jgi:hypothetical protein